MIIPNYPQLAGGSGDQTVLGQTVKGLEKEHDLRVLILSDKDKEIKMKTKTNCFRTIIYDHNVSHIEPINNYFSKIRSWYRQLLFLKFMSDFIFSKVKHDIDKSIIQFKPDIVYFEQTGYPMFHWIDTFTKNNDIKFFIRVHDSFSLNMRHRLSTFKKYNFQLVKYYLRYLFYFFYEKQYLKKWDSVLTLTETEKKFYGKNYNFKTPIKVTKTGVDTDYFNIDKANKRDIDIIYTGTMGWKPNVENVVWFSNVVLPILINYNRDIKFYIVGLNPSKEVLNLNSENIIVTGAVEDIRDYVKRAKVSFILGFSGSGKKIKIMELMSMGIPLICEKNVLHGYDEKHVEGAIIIDKKDPEKIADMINLLLTDKKYLNQKSKKMRTNAKLFFNFKNIGYKNYFN